MKKDLTSSGHYAETVQKGKNRLLKKWQRLEQKIYLSKKRKEDGGKVHVGETRTLRFLHGGEISIKRRRYVRKVGAKSEFSHLLDRKLGWDKRVLIDSEVKEEILCLLEQKESGVAIQASLRKAKVKISRMTISKTLKDSTKKAKKEGRISLPKNRLYFNLDEGFVSVRKEGQRVEKMRLRSVSAYSGRVGDKPKKRWRLVNKRRFVECYQPGEVVDSLAYAERLEGWLKKHYIYNRQTLLFGATDGASAMKKIVKLIPGAKLVASKFHVGRNGEDRWYLANNREGMANGKHPDCLGYSAESDIAYLKSKLGFGNRIYSWLGFQNLLRLDNITVT